MRDEISAETQKIAVKLYQAGWTNVEVAAFCEISRSSVQRCLVRQGIEARPLGYPKGRRRVSDERYAALLKEWTLAGESRKATVALKYGYAHEASARVAVNAYLRSLRAKERCP